MKNTHKKKMKVLTFGELVTEAYDNCGKRHAGEMIQFAVNHNLIAFRGKQRVVIS